MPVHDTEPFYAAINRKAPNMPATITYLTTVDATARYPDDECRGAFDGAVPTLHQTAAIEVMARSLGDDSTLFVSRDWEGFLIVMEERPGPGHVTFDVITLTDDGRAGFGGVNHPTYMPVHDLVAQAHGQRRAWEAKHGTHTMGRPPVHVAWDGGPTLDALHVLPTRWNGWAIPVMTRAQVEALITAADGLANDYPHDTDRLSLDGDTLVVTPPAHAGPDSAGNVTDDMSLDPSRIEPVHGEYVIDLGWTFDIVDDFRGSDDGVGQVIPPR
jgi:hypothetical protein